MMTPAGGVQPPKAAIYAPACGGVDMFWVEVVFLKRF